MKSNQSELRQALMSTAQLSEYLSVSPSYVRDRRANGDWVERTHWIYLNPRNHKAGIRYIPALCLNWLLTQDQPEQHEAYIKNYQQQQKIAV